MPTFIRLANLADQAVGPARIAKQGNLRAVTMPAIPMKDFMEPVT